MHPRSKHVHPPTPLQHQSVGCAAATQLLLALETNAPTNEKQSSFHETVTSPTTITLHFVIAKSPSSRKRGHTQTLTHADVDRDSNPMPRLSAVWCGCGDVSPRREIVQADWIRRGDLLHQIQQRLHQPRRGGRASSANFRHLAIVLRPGGSRALFAQARRSTGPTQNHRPWNVAHIVKRSVLNICLCTGPWTCPQRSAELRSFPK